MRKLLLLLMILLWPLAGYSRERAWGYCEQGGYQVLLQGIYSDTNVQRSFKSCTVTVYDAGTTNLSSVYSDNSGTVKANPFTSDANGYWFFYANNGRYDVHFSDSDIPAPYTQGDYLLCDPQDATGAFSCTGGGGTSCPLGPTDTRYVDSTAGSDSNNGRNWCSAYATEQTAVDALAATGGWVYVAPNYGGAAPTGVATNVHILETNQFDAVGSSVRRYSFPDWTVDTENVYSNFQSTTGALSDATGTITALNPFGAVHSRATITGNMTVPDTSTNDDESIGMLGLSHALGLSTQSTGVEGICYSEFNAVDCSGVVGVAGTSAVVQASTSLEAGWFQVSNTATPNNADGIVIRLAGNSISSNVLGGTLPNAGIDFRVPGVVDTGNMWPTGIYMEDFTVTTPMYLGINYPANSDRGNNGIKFGWQYNSSTAENSQIRVTGSTNVLFPFGGNFQFLNNRVSSTVTLPTDVSGYVQVGAINTVTYSATPTFDRSQGLIQKITLTGNVTSSTLTNCLAGQLIIFDIVQDGVGAHTFVAPANLHSFGTVDGTAGYHNTQSFYCDGTSTNSGGWATGVMVSGN